jgi:hypothetical protein
MIDISIKSPPPPTPPPHSGVDPVVSVPRSHQVDETDAERNPQKQRNKRPKKRGSNRVKKEQKKQSSNDSSPHIDNYA